MNSKTSDKLVTLGIALSFCFVIQGMQPAAFGQGKVGVARELVEQLARSFAKEVADEGADKLTSRVTSVLAKVGDDGAEAISKVGPRAVRLIEEAGEDSAKAARLLARYGDEAVWAVDDPARRALLAKLGDDAGEALVRHGSIGEKILTQTGEPAVAALKSLSAQNGRRLAMLSEETATQGLAKNPDLLAVVGKYGDRSMDFVWRNKGALAAGTALAVFVANPEPFLDGSMDLAEIAASQVAKPLVEQIALRTQWTPVLITIAAMIGLFVWYKWPRARVVRP